MRLLFFVDPKWAFGLIHTELIKHLSAHGWEVDLLPWDRSYQRDEMTAIVAHYDRVVTMCSVLDVVRGQYAIPAEKLIVFAYSDYDYQKARVDGQDREFDLFSGYAVPSHNLLSISLSIGITRIPEVLPLGLTLSRYACPLPTELKVAGYGTAMSRKNHFGVEFKRGALAEECAKAAGLEFRPAKSWHYLTIPGYWQSVDCCLASALYETAPIPQLEAAASGRLVLTSAVGNTAELAVRSIVRLLPSGEKYFRSAATMELTHYRDHPDAFVEACTEAREGMQCYDWKNVLPQWTVFFESCRA